MGAYIYKIKPSAIAKIENLPDGMVVHCATYAYKPWPTYGLDGCANAAANKHCEKSTGIVACRAAWKRKGTRPAFVACLDPKVPETYWHKIPVPGTTNCFDGEKRPITEFTKPYEWSAVWAYPKGLDPESFMDDVFHHAPDNKWCVGTVWVYPPLPGKKKARYVFRVREIDALDFDALEYGLEKAA